MPNELISELAWLPRPPAGFRERCGAALDQPDRLGRTLAELAAYGHDETGLKRLNRLVGEARGKGLSLAPLRPLRLLVVSNATTDYIGPAITASALRHGLAVECFAGEYGRTLQELLPNSTLGRVAPECVLLAIDWRGMPIGRKLGDAEGSSAVVDAALDYLTTLRNAVRENSSAVCIFQTIAPPPETLFGSMDRAIAGTLRRIIADLNRAMEGWVAKSNDVLLDVDFIASMVGLSNWHSPVQWHLAKLPFSQTYVPLYAEHVSRLLGAIRGLGRRCLVLDLDNTLWGGVIGDDGIGGIRLGQGDPVGEAYSDFQRYILAFRERGVVLAVSSKNEDAIARLPFREHAEMLIREEHIAVFQANWNDKAANIRTIATTLNLGLESLAFVDDNPFERELVRRELPQVAVPEMPDDPALYTATLSAAGLFETVAFTDEDRKRAEYYSGNAQRAAIQAQSGDIETYLASLAMEITFQPFDEPGRKRITQLINKSNQFNLTTKRLTEPEVASLESDGSTFTLQVRLSDIFGDNGMISVIICSPRPDNCWHIDVWLMSCRVLGRGVERMVLREILRHARRRGISLLTGAYVPSGRNALVEQHYAQLGFTLVETSEDGGTTWALPIVDGAEPPAAPMLVRAVGFDEGVSLGLG